MLLTNHRIDAQHNQLRLKVAGNICCEYKACESISIPVQSDSSPGYMAVDTRNEKFRHIQHANPCAGVRDDILHYPKAKLFAGQNGNSFGEAISETQKMISHQRPFLHVDRRISRHEVEQLQNNRRFRVSDDGKAQVPSVQEEPTCGIANHIAESGLHPWTINQCRLFFRSLRSFF